MAECIYCGKSEKLTREHILPSFVYQHHYQIEGQNTVVGWREKPEKVIAGEAIIKDVCSNCNNIILSEYDSHVKGVLESADIFQKNFLCKETSFHYDYALLSRWLLKVSYNSSRASGKQIKEFESFKHYILDKTLENSSYFLTCGLLKPVKLSEEEFIQHRQAFGLNKPGYINPFFTCISWAPNLQDGYTVKQIVIGALVFHICVFTNKMNREEKKRVKKQHLASCKGMKVISVNKTKHKAMQLPITFLDSMAPHMLRDNVRPEMDKLLSSQNTGTN
ncbi:hypothetical protein MHM89_13995 [Pseudoalteromonas sp. CNC9-20]|uniref:hypothetical protein n=1 Tax=Pseudoalteromonas sp. CNC9-20 TaxID=2917750 RepID=UPI001EF5D761|nr:hypothetical protein [Pseudoalteromonas sp. CNC9-20]MCG7571045.1 hypothetical protein [Pseudoalteromonas sp. CNC9-20]